jgi:hypothetical protein
LAKGRLEVASTVSEFLITARDLPQYDLTLANIERTYELLTDASQHSMVEDHWCDANPECALQDVQVKHRPPHGRHRQLDLFEVEVDRDDTLQSLRATDPPLPEGIQKSHVPVGRSLIA